MEFVLKHENEEPVDCDSCGSRVPTSDFNWGPPYTQNHPRPFRALCEFCCTTMTSRYTENPSNDLFTQLRAEQWKAAAAVFNMLKHPLVT